MKWKPRLRYSAPGHPLSPSEWKSEIRRRRHAREALIAERLSPITLHPWRMKVATAGVWLASKGIRVLLKAVTFLARHAVVRQPRRRSR